MLNHRDTDIDTQAERAERRLHDPIFTNDRKVQAAQKRLDRLSEANASPAVLARAAAALRSARLDVQEAAAVKIAATRSKTLAETKQKQRDMISREQVYRLSDAAPCVVVEMFGIRVTFRPEKPQDATQRLHVGQDIVETLLVMRRMFERCVGGVKLGHEPLIDKAFVIRDLQDRLRRGIAAGAVEISEV